MINILSLFSWTTWFLITIIIILVFWIFYGGRQEYEFVGVKPLSTKSLFENLGPIEYVSKRDLGINYKHKLSHGNIIPNGITNIIPNGIYNSIPIKKKENENKSCKGEDLVAEILETILSSKVKRNTRPSFLRNPESGKNLELDCYNEEYAIAVEYNGIQHYKFPSAFHKTEKEFYDQLYRDKLKKKLCDEAGVYLICVPYWVDNYGCEDGHLEEKISGKKNLFISREVKYKRIYDYLYEKISEYFRAIFPEEYSEENEEDEYNEEEENEEDEYTEEEENEEDEEAYSDEEEYTEEEEEYSDNENGLEFTNGFVENMSNIYEIYE